MRRPSGAHNRRSPDATAERGNTPVNGPIPWQVRTLSTSVLLNVFSWSNGGNVLNFVSCMSYFPLNFAHGRGVVFDATAVSRLYVILAAVNLASAACYMAEVTCTGVPFWPDLLAPITGLISAVLYQITGVLYMFEATPAVLSFVLWTEFTASALYFADSIFYTALWYRFQFHEHELAGPVTRRLRRWQALTASGINEDPSPDIGSIPASRLAAVSDSQTVRRKELARRAWSEVAAQFFTLTLQENMWFVAAALLYVLDTAFALAAHYVVLHGPLRTPPSTLIVHSQELLLVSRLGAAADGIYAVQSWVYFAVGGRRMGHVPAPRDDSHVVAAV